MGASRVMCGDSTERDDVMKLLRGERCDACLTDPPYACGENYRTHNDGKDELKYLIDGFVPITRQLCDVVAITPGIQNIPSYPAFDWILCWYYGVGPGRTPWGFTAWQPILVYGKDPFLAAGLGARPDGFNKMMTGADMEINRGLNHPCPKPVSVWKTVLERVSPRKGQRIFDPFGGSGTTVIACEQSQRVALLMEIDPIYCDVIVERWQKFTGKKATLEGDSRTFDEIKVDRLLKQNAETVATAQTPYPPEQPAPTAVQIIPSDVCDAQPGVIP